MKKILIFVAFFAACVGYAGAGVRSGATHTARPAVAEKRVVSQTARATTSTARSATTNTPERATTSRAAVSARTTGRNVAGRESGTASARTATQNTKESPRQTIARAASDQSIITETRTGAAYERCKTAYFTCMDQFCKLKNDDYRRCSCHDRVNEFVALRDTLQTAGDRLNAFNSNLDVVGMSAAQATALVTASEGEIAMSKDKSSAKAILQAIMNSIRGGDTSVSGQYSDLNSINLSFDAVNAFGNADSGQIIAAYNGQDLYNAVYTQCRAAVASDCNNASLQRAINAYLMAIESDCNTVQTAIENQQKQLKSAVRESSAMLDLARVENRKAHNIDDITTCVNNVEKAILSEQVCGENYHRCLDNGEYIDITTGKPIAGVAKFYELQNLLRFADGVNAAEQKLSQITSNRQFVQRFESRVKKFAEPALDKCVESADVVWAEYLDKALLAIYYAQRAKVDEIKQGCFDFVSACYISGDTSITNAMSQLTDDASIVILPNKIVLNTKLCSDYIESCNNMFADNIIKNYIDYRQDTDTLTACRAVAKQCFDRFGGRNYENFYYPYSGLFTPGDAMKWFTLYEDSSETTIVSDCAKQIASVDACNSPDLLKRAFGGFATVDDSAYTGNNPRNLLPVGVATEVYNQITDNLMTQCANLQGKFIERRLFTLKQEYALTYKSNDLCALNIDSAMALLIPLGQTIYDVQSSFLNQAIRNNYNLGNSEIICPSNYAISVDTESWGICSCWENGGRRSKFGRSASCVPEVPVEKWIRCDISPTDTCETPYTCQTFTNINYCADPNNNNDKQEKSANDASCYADKKGVYTGRRADSNFSNTDWCTQTTFVTSQGQICPYGFAVKTVGGVEKCCKCTDNGGGIYDCSDTNGISTYECVDMTFVPVGVQ